MINLAFIKLPLVKNCAGICLAEMMIAMTAGIVVLSATIQMLNHFQHRLWVQHDTIGSHQDQRMAMRVMEEELRAAGSGSLQPNVVHKADRQDLEFFANIGGYTTNLTQAVSSIQQELHVTDGLGWAKGKHIVICSSERCTRSRLAKDGQRSLLSLVSATGQSFPIGSEVTITNHVHYYLSRNRSGAVSLMRQVDGGADALVSDVTLFSLSYVDKSGRLTVDPTAVTRVRIELSVGKDHRPISSETGLRTR